MEASVEAQSLRSRGRPRIPEKWTRVINADTADIDAVRTYQLAPELLMAAGMPKEQLMIGKDTWAPKFFPKQFVKEHQAIKVEDYALAQEDLKRLGQQVTALRLQYR